MLVPLLKQSSLMLKSTKKLVSLSSPGLGLASRYKVLASSSSPEILQVPQQDINQPG